MKFSIILPTLNESKNIEILIPDIISELNHLNTSDFEIIVVDDNSVDDIVEVMKSFSKNYKNVSLYIRKENPSLPLSILEGIEKSKYEYIMWLDADGSMGAKYVKLLVDEIKKYPEEIIIGSRFVKGGGYKGVSLKGDDTFIKSMRNVYNSEDSVLAVILSKLFNNLLSSFLNVGVRDITSGFIIGKKTYFDEEIFIGASYGDYFIKLLINARNKGVKCREVGYICTPRLYGVSKTGTNYFQLFKRGLPYIKTIFSLKGKK